MICNVELCDETSILLHTTDYHPICSIDLNVLKPKMGFIYHFCTNNQFDFWSQCKSQWQIIYLFLLYIKQQQGWSEDCGSILPHWQILGLFSGHSAPSLLFLMSFGLIWFWEDLLDHFSEATFTTTGTCVCFGRTVFCELNLR